MKKVDCRRMNAASAVLKTKKALMSLNARDVLKVVATDPGSVADMAAFSRSTGHEILEQSEGGGEYTFVLRKVGK